MKRFLESAFASVARLVFISVLAFQLVACGTILYPERKGQTHGRIDPAIAVLDGLCLLLFIVPGVIAFGVDFATGAIYLPPGGKKKKLKINKEKFSYMDSGMTVVQLDRENLTLENIARAVSERTGVRVDLASSGLRVYDIDKGDMAALEAAVSAGAPNSHVLRPVHLAALAGADR